MLHRQAVEKIFMMIISLEQILRGLSYAVEEIPLTNLNYFQDFRVLCFHDDSKLFKFCCILQFCGFLI